MSEVPEERKVTLYPNKWAKESDANTVRRPSCHCMDVPVDGRWRKDMVLHAEEQDTTCEGWSRLLELIDQAAADGREEFSPSREMSPQQWSQIVTLPSTISKLKDVKHLILYGSSLVRIPPEIGEMTNLEQFTPYTSYRLHWFPYEITRCQKLVDSTVSTRAIYGNFKNRPPFPGLPHTLSVCIPKRCSVCDGSFNGPQICQVWISLRVATDVLPLLVHACSDVCINRLPTPANDYFPKPHLGGLDLN